MMVKIRNGKFGSVDNEFEFCVSGTFSLEVTDAPETANLTGPVFFSSILSAYDLSAYLPHSRIVFFFAVRK